MGSPMTELLCPKCQVAMRSLERSGVTIEHCTECGGVFLDRGELERLEETEMTTQVANREGGVADPAPAGTSGQALFGELIKLARQYRGPRGRF